MSYQIALDGPSGAGKSTVARLIAQKLGIMYLDTGAMYRAVGLFMHNAGADFANEDHVGALLAQCRLDVVFLQGKQHVLLDGNDVSEQIREHYVSKLASDISRLNCVRQYLVQRQRSIAAKNSCILDGRDICLHVLPNARYKFFLTASAQVRAKRRADELRAKGQQVNEQEVYNDICARDYADSHREFSPLVQAPDAVLIDSSDMTIEQVVQKIVSYIEE